VVESIDSDKIKIIDTVWKEEDFVNGRVNAIQTNIALNACEGDWCFYVQADEVVHEKYLPVIKDRCIELQNDDEIEGLVFDYRHFWGDYDHYQISHGWYKREVRVIKNNLEIESNNSALKTKIITAIEQKLERQFGGKVYLSGHRNYKLIGNK